MGFVDFYLEPFRGKYADVQYSYLIELKYLTRSAFTDEKLKEALQKSESQLHQYAADARVVKHHRWF